MKIEQEFTVKIPVERMYREMNNVAEIGYCIEGVKKVEALSETETRWVVEARAGFMARTFQLSGVITEQRPPHYLSFTASGQDLKLSGFFELAPLGQDETKCRAVVDCDVMGSFKTIVDLMAKGPQQQMIAKTIANVRQRLEALAAGADSAALRAPVVPESGRPRSHWRGWIAKILRELRAFVGLSTEKQVR